MKSLLLAIALSSVVGHTANAQVNSVAAASQPAKTRSPNPPATGTRARVLGQKSNVVSSNGNVGRPATFQSQPKSDFNNHSERVSSGSNDATSKTVADNSNKTATNLKPSGTTTTTNNNSIAASQTQVYRVGVKDVLDIQLAELAGKNSTLFTVMAGGMLEYPLAGNPFPVLGLTTNEIAAMLRQRIKIFEDPNITVNVRDYASHVVTVSGFVAAPGSKVLRREAVPLYAVLSEALILPEAARATIMRQGRYPLVIDLKDTNLSGTLIIPGDVIKVAGPPAGPTEFYFVSGEVSSPGQKPFHAGLTLTQAIIASGGTSAHAGARVKVSRQAADGRLTTEEYNLRKIQTGKMPDPVLQTGDRIEVTN